MIKRGSRVAAVCWLLIGLRHDNIKYASPFLEVILRITVRRKPISCNSLWAIHQGIQQHPSSSFISSELDRQSCYFFFGSIHLVQHCQSSITSNCCCTRSRRTTKRITKVYSTCTTWRGYLHGKQIDWIIFRGYCLSTFT